MECCFGSEMGQCNEMVDGMIRGAECVAWLDGMIGCGCHVWVHSFGQSSGRDMSGECALWIVDCELRVALQFNSIQFNQHTHHSFSNTLHTSFSSSYQARLPAELKHINKRRKRN